MIYMGGGEVMVQREELDTSVHCNRLELGSAWPFEAFSRDGFAAGRFSGVCKSLQQHGGQGHNRGAFRGRRAAEAARLGTGVQ